MPDGPVPCNNEHGDRAIIFVEENSPKQARSGAVICDDHVMANILEQASLDELNRQWRASLAVTSNAPTGFPQLEASPWLVERLAATAAGPSPVFTLMNVGLQSGSFSENVDVLRTYAGSLVMIEHSWISLVRFERMAPNYKQASDVAWGVDQFPASALSRVSLTEVGGESWAMQSHVTLAFSDGTTFEQPIPSQGRAEMLKALGLLRN